MGAAKERFAIYNIPFKSNFEILALRMLQAATH